MKRAWQDGREDNVDATHSLTIDVYLPPDTKVIERAYLRLRLKNFRSYSQSTDLGGSGTLYTAYTDSSSWDLGGAYSLPDIMQLAGTHNHAGAVSNDGQHAHGLVPHQHGITLPNHQHNNIHGIYEGTAASNVTVIINGIDRTVALTGSPTINVDQDSLNIAQYLTATGWNTITLTSTILGRIHATLFIEIYLP